MCINSLKEQLTRLHESFDNLISFKYVSNNNQHREHSGGDDNDDIFDGVGGFGK